MSWKTLTPTADTPMANLARFKSYMEGMEHIEYSLLAIIWLSNLSFNMPSKAFSWWNLTLVCQTENAELVLLMWMGWSPYQPRNSNVSKRRLLSIDICQIFSLWTSESAIYPDQLSPLSGPLVYEAITISISLCVWFGMHECYCRRVGTCARASVCVGWCWS